MRILVFGAGVLGCNLANNLFKAGKDVTLLARGEWCQTLQNNGLKIKNKLAFGRTTTTKLNVISTLNTDDKYDVIFVVVRYTQIKSVLPVLSANLSPNIVFVGNDVSVKNVAQQLPEKRVLFAFASSAGHREKDKVVSVDMKKITIGQLYGSHSNKPFIDSIFEGTKYKVTFESNMEDWLLCHAAAVLPASFACYYTEGNLKKIKRDKEYLNKLVDAVIEGYSAIKLAGHSLLPKSEEKFQTKKFKRVNYHLFKFLASTFVGKVCVSDHAMNAVDEMGKLASDFESFMDERGATHPVWTELKQNTNGYLNKEE
jgi:2-dehydropantoate 2-reductase